MKHETARFPEREGGPLVVAVAWSFDLLGNVRHVETSFEGRILRAEPRRADGRGAWVYRLDDGRMLTVLPCVTHFALGAVDARIDGRRLPGSAYDPARYLGASRFLLLVVALLDLGISALAVTVSHTQAATAAVCVGTTAVVMACAARVGRGSRGAARLVIATAGVATLVGLVLPGVWTVMIPLHLIAAATCWGALRVVRGLPVARRGADDVSARS